MNYRVDYGDATVNTPSTKHFDEIVLYKLDLINFLHRYPLQMIAQDLKHLRKLINWLTTSLLYLLKQSNLDQRAPRRQGFQIISGGRFFQF